MYLQPLIHYGSRNNAGGKINLYFILHSVSVYPYRTFLCLEADIIPFAWTSVISSELLNYISKFRRCRLGLCANFNLPFFTSLLRSQIRNFVKFLYPFLALVF